MPNSITPPPHLLKKFSTEARDESNKRNGTGYLKTFAKLCIEWANSKSTSNDRQIRSSEITPPPELIARWEEDWHYSKVKHIELEDHIATQAAQWGADQELEACCKTLDMVNGSNLGCSYWSQVLRSGRRPKPPSLKEQAIAALDRMHRLPTLEDSFIIRDALEAIND
jgi:hypothetical protein